MTITHLIDTDWVVHYLNSREDIARRLDVLKHQGLGLSTVALGELYEGVYYSRDPEGDERGLHEFLQGVILVSLDMWLPYSTASHVDSSRKKVLPSACATIACCRWAGSSTPCGTDCTTARLSEV